MKIGDRIHAKTMARDSFYKQAKGVVTKIENGFVMFNADEFMDKWSTRFERHPGYCATSCRNENAVVIEAR